MATGHKPLKRRARTCLYNEIELRDERLGMSVLIANVSSFLSLIAP